MSTSHAAHHCYGLVDARTRGYRQAHERFGVRNACQTGSYVVVGKNLDASGDCLVIGADFVTLDLGGLAISGNGGGTGILARPPDLVGITVRTGP